MAEDIVYRGRTFNLKVQDVTLPSGRQTKREIVEHLGSAAIVPIIGEHVILVRQFRHAVGEALLEIPAGTLRRGEDPEDCAARELVEETGYHPGRLEKILTCYSSPGYSSERMHIFLATGLMYRGVKPEEDEEIEVVKLRLTDALDMIRRGEVKDGKTICGLLTFITLQAQS